MPIISIKTKRSINIARGHLALMWVFWGGRLARLFLKKSLHRRYLARLVDGTGLFDRDYYLAVNADVAEAGVDPVLHYVAHGDREGRSPMPLFDPVYYRSQIDEHYKRYNTLLHYHYLGRYQSVSPSSWFDLKYYLKKNKDVARANIEPLQHYLRYGGREGRSPNPSFDGSYYLRSNPELLLSGENPLLHYLRTGRQQETRTCEAPGDSREDLAVPGELALPVAPRPESWDGLPRRANVKQAVIDVVMPVYRGQAETLRCLYSVLSADCKVAFELIVIDDASPEQELKDELARLSSQGFFCLSINPENRGFVTSVNQGMMLHPDRDVVLLNSDTEVYDGWLDRLQVAAERHPRTGTVTPLSNNATICSYPRFDHDNPFPLELGYAEVDALAATVNAGVEVEMPSAVGFCMYIRRDCLNEVGLFDAQRFGKGYGEENDFCQRAIRKGWRNIAAADVFVRHWGATSFRGEKALHVHRAMKIIGKLYPDYHEDVARFVRNDPLREARSRLDRARLQRLRRDRNVLVVCHNRGGGSERHVQEDIARLTREGCNVLLLRPVENQPAQVAVRHPDARFLPNLPTYPVTDVEKMTVLLRDLEITEVHTHGLVDFVPEAATSLTATAKALGLRLEVNLHDYKVICPRINLVGGNGFYCGEPAEEGCNACLARNASDFKATDIGAWRAIHHQALQAADLVLVPDKEVAGRFSRYFPDIHFEVSPHENIDTAGIQIRTPALTEGETLRIVIIGAIGRIKGFGVLLACAKDARQRRLPLEFVLMGYSLNDRMLQDAGVRVTGKYQEPKALELLERLNPHVVWLPSVWPETYSYTLSLALLAARPVVAFDLGAIAARLRRVQLGNFILPLDVANDPGKVNTFFLEKFFVSTQRDSR